MTDEFIVFDMFAGAGGLSEGFFRSGYEFISHIEMDKYASMTLETRAIYHALKADGREDYYYDYIAGEISREDFLKERRKFSDVIPAGIINSEISAFKDKRALYQPFSNIPDLLYRCNPRTSLFFLSLHLLSA
ncbi:MAG: DNA cytosine methyltransferase [Methanophagales archaeon]|nr:DNA cytosine methyltransferase [Methanophagales archaeon]